MDCHNINSSVIADLVSKVIQEKPHNGISKSKTINSIKEINLKPKQGKTYWQNCNREWREEFIYFVLVDRFQDSSKRHPLEFPDRHFGFGDEQQLQQSCHGTLRGIIKNIEYIKNFGCTAIWFHEAHVCRIL